jgi:hypothetical protein
MASTEATVADTPLQRAQDAIQRAKALPVWGGVPHSLHVELDVIFKAVAEMSAASEYLPLKQA